MKIVGIIREFDSTGRISLPIEMRKQIWGQDNRKAEIFATEEGVLIKPYTEQKAFAADEVTKAIDTFAEEIKRYIATEYGLTDISLKEIEEIAERMKGGAE